jgi:hypothetical protein
MKRLSSLLLFAALAAAASLAAPASAAKLSLQKTVKLCKAEIARLPSPPKTARMDEYATRFGEDRATIVFKVRTPDGRLNRLLCDVDRQTDAATLSFRYPPPETGATGEAAAPPSSPG